MRRFWGALAIFAAQGVVGWAASHAMDSLVATQAMRDFGVVAVWIAAILGGAYLAGRVVAGTGVAAPESHPSRMPASPATTQQSVSTERQFVVDTVTPDYLRQFHDGETEVRAKKLIEPYIGKWIRVSGYVINVRRESAFRTPPIVRVTLVSQLPEKDHYYDIDLMAEFDDARWSEALSALTKETKVAIQGKIESVDSRFVSLSECELLEVGSRP